MLTACNNFSTATIPASGASYADLLLVRSSFEADHPEIFWLSSSFSMIYSGENLSGIRLSYNGTSSGRSQKAAALNAQIEAALKTLNAGMNKFEIELALHDWVCNKVVYDTATANNPSSPTSPYTYSAYGALVEGRALCEGYSRAFQLLLNQVGIKCTLITGESNGVGHMWNAVNIDNKWYHVDSTWNDSSKQIYHGYFNLTTTDIDYSRQIDPDFESSEIQNQLDAQGQNMPSFNFNFPTCTATDANYFYVYKSVLSGTNDASVLRAAFAAADARGETHCEFVFSDSRIYGSSAVTPLALNKRLQESVNNVVLKSSSTNHASAKHFYVTWVAK